MRKELFILEVGVLTAPDYECGSYCIDKFFDKEFGFNDENRITYLTYEEAYAYAQKYMKDGVNKTYAIIHSGVYNLDDDDMDEIQSYNYCEQSLDNPDMRSTLYFAYKVRIEQKKRAKMTVEEIIETLQEDLDYIMQQLICYDKGQLSIGNERLLFLQEKRAYIENLLDKIQ